MRHFVVLLAVLFAVPVIAQSDSEPYSEVRILISDRSELVTLVDLAEIDHLHLEETAAGYEVRAVVSSTARGRLDQSGYSYELLIEDVATQTAVRGSCPSLPPGTPEGFFYGSMGCYPTLDEYEAAFDQMRADYPHLITQKESIGSTWEERPIWVMRITAADDPESVPEVLYTGLHHAREPQSAAGVLYFMYYLLEGYESDPEVTALLENRAFYFIPILNPDGYRRNQQTHPNGGGMWRKNRRPNAGSGSFGVDLNRNYGYMWDCNGAPYTSCNPSSDTYAGPHAFSELETQALREWLATRTIGAAYNYHSYGRYWLHPYGYDSPVFNNDVYTPDHDLFTKLSAEITRFNDYTYGLAGEVLYEAIGTSDDWMYGEQNEKPKMYSFTPEIGGFSDNFWPSPHRIVPLALDVLHPNLVLAWFVGVHPREVLSSVFEEEVSPGNGYLDPGETGLAYVEIENFGVGRMDDARARINSTDPDVLTAPGNWTTFVLDDTTDVTLPPLGFTISPDAPLGVTGSIVLELELEGGGIMQLPLADLLIGTPLMILDDPLDSFEKWTLDQWGPTEDAASPPFALTDSPEGNYPPGVTNTLQLTQPLDFADAEEAFLRFNARWDIRPTTDFLQVRVSTDGQTWTALPGNHTRTGSGNGVQPAGEPGYAGTQSSWLSETIDLSEYDGVPALHLQFQMRSASTSITADGFYLDDVEVIGGLYNGNSVENEPDNESLHQAILHAPYPNPALGTTYLRFDIPQGGVVELRVFDLLGREVTRLVDDVYAPGSHTIAWDTEAANLAPGHYILELKTPTTRSIQRAVIVR